MLHVPPFLAVDPLSGSPRFTSGRLESAGKRQFGHTRIESRIALVNQWQ
jgi:hypothetical protein